MYNQYREGWIEVICGCMFAGKTEHSQYNMDRYKKLLKSAKCLSVDNLKKRISQ